MVVTAKPEKIAPYFLMLSFREKVKMIREICWVIVPKTKAKSIDRKIPDIMVMALEKFKMSLKGVDPKSIPFAIEVKIPPAKEAPNNSKTSETVVEVGSPRLL